MGAGATALTVIVTVSGAEAPFASLTTSENTSEAAGDPNATDGAVKLGRAVLAPASVTGKPDACVHWKLKGSPDGSVLALPSRVTGAPALALWSGPALATGRGAGAGAACASMELARTLRSRCSTPSTSTFWPGASAEKDAFFPATSMCVFASATTVVPSTTRRSGATMVWMVPLNSVFLPGWKAVWIFLASTLPSLRSRPWTSATSPIMSPSMRMLSPSARTLLSPSVRMVVAPMRKSLPSTEAIFPRSMTSGSPWRAALPSVESPTATLTTIPSVAGGSSTEASLPCPS